MHRIDATGYAPGNLWTAGNPSTGTPPTTIGDVWLNDFQENNCVAVEAAGITLAKGVYTQLRDAIIILGGNAAIALGKNLLANSSFDYFQRGGAVNSPQIVLNTGGQQGYFAPDRWRVTCGTSGQVTLSQQAHALAAPPAPSDAFSENPNGTTPFGAYLRWIQTAGASTTPILEQRCDYALEATDSQKVTFSIYLRVSSGTLAVTPQFQQYFGTGGGASSPVLVTGSPWTVTTSWQRFSFTATLGSISGKSVNLQYWISTQLLLPTSTTFTLDADAAQFEIAPIATAYVRPDPQVDRELCSRYFWKSYPINVTPGTAGLQNNGDLIGENDLVDCFALKTRLPVLGRAFGTVTWYSPTTGAAGKIERPLGTDKLVTLTIGTTDQTPGYPQTVSVGAALTAARAHVAVDMEV